MVLGNRKGFHQAMPPHNMTLSIMGAGMLWVGWFGFNGGSAWPPTVTLAWRCWLPIFLRRRVPAPGCCWNASITVKPLLGAVTGMVAGLGTITPASGFVGPGVV